MGGRVSPLSAAEAAAAVLAAETDGRAVVEMLVVDGPHAGRRALRFEDGTGQGSLGSDRLDAAVAERAGRLLRTGGTELAEIPAEGVRVFLAAHRPAEPLLIVGAGHIAVPLAALGVRLGFAVTVLDDREEFATTERFPGAADVLRCDFEADPFAGVAVDGHTFVALVTRGHRWDFDCLQRLVARDERPRYIGMIGSRRRVRAALRALLEAGVPREVLARIHAPIGIEIGAETPEEIAISIAAEMIAVRRGVDVESMTTRERVLERLLPGEDQHEG